MLCVPGVASPGHNPNEHRPASWDPRLRQEEGWRVMKRIDPLPTIYAEPIGWLDRPGLFTTQPNQVNS